MRDVEAIAAEEESYERFSVIETENGYAVWDDIRDEIYVDAVSYTHLLPEKCRDGDGGRLWDAGWRYQ